MIESVRQFLQVMISGQAYLLPSAASLSIEQRESLIQNADGGSIVAWHESRGSRWPAYEVGADLSAGSSGTWQRAVFLRAAPVPIGLAADEIHLIPPQSGIEVMPFFPLGRAPGPAGHLFNGARVDQEPAMLLLEPNALVAHLLALGGSQ
jgi:hypothetical protein